MRLKYNKGLKLNNIFTILTIGIMSVVMFIYFKYIKKSEALLICEKESIYINQIFDKELLAQAYEFHQKGQYKIKGGVIKSIWTPSKLESIINIKELDTKLKNTFKDQQDRQKYMLVDYEIIENDRLNPHKKVSTLGKNQTGSLVVNFKLNGKLACRIQTKLTDYSNNEIEKKLICSMEVFYDNGQ